MAPSKECDISQPVSAVWDETRVIPPDGWERLKKGLQPQQMEDRWIVAHTVENGEEGIIFARSWTRYIVAKITVIPAGDDGKSRKITKITWEADNERWRCADREQEAKDIVVGFSRFFEVDLADERPS